jgi:hypothetical protein
MPVPACRSLARALFLDRGIGQGLICKKGR